MPLRGVITFRAVTREGGVFWLSDEPMLLPELRKAVLEANLELVRKGLVLYTFGNASGISRQKSLVVIKPSGVPYERLRPADLVVTDLNGKIVEGKLRPSSDLPTHLVLYKSFPAIGGISHTHSEYATAWAQARRPIPCFGTTHADSFHGPVPVTGELKDSEISEAYEENTGHAIVRTFRDHAGESRTDPGARARLGDRQSRSPCGARSRSRDSARAARAFPRRGQSWPGWTRPRSKRS